MEKKLQWLLMVVSAAPIQTLDDARYKAEWLNELADEADPKEEVAED